MKEGWNFLKYLDRIMPYSPKLKWNEMKKAPSDHTIWKGKLRDCFHQSRCLVVKNEQWTALDVMGKLAKNLDGDRSEKWRERERWSECCDKPRRTRVRGRGLEVDPAPRGHLTIGDFSSLGGNKRTQTHPTTGLGHYRPLFPRLGEFFHQFYMWQFIPIILAWCNGRPSSSRKCWKDKDSLINRKA